VKKLGQPERKRQCRERLINLFQTVFASFFCRVAGAKEVFGARFRITYHEREEMLADVDNMFS
jgi:hypothetical protein